MDPLDSTTGEIRGATGRQFLSWIIGLEQEVEFWDDWFSTKGLQWPEEFQARLRTCRPVPPYLERAVARCDRTPLAILDVGSGPLSQLGSFQWNRPVELRAVDPLAATYVALIRRERLIPPVCPEVGFAEDLSAFVRSGSVDIVHCANALDHSFDPLRGIREMISVLRVEGTAVLLHIMNEAVNASYTGLHQWNFDLRDGRALLWNREHQHDLADLLATNCTVAAERIEEGGIWNLLIYIRKHAPLDRMDEAHKNARIRDLLTTMVDVALRIPTLAPPRQRLRRGLKRFLRGHAPALLAAYRGARTTKWLRSSTEVKP
jgi:SAM-dependent methyltransferase